MIKEKEDSATFVLAVKGLFSPQQEDLKRKRKKNISLFLKSGFSMAA
jgi:hypothetical protein